MSGIRVHHDKAYDAFELQTDDIPCKLIAAVFHRENDEHRLNVDEAEKYANLFAVAPALLAACKKIADHEAKCNAKGIGYDIEVYNIAKAAIVLVKKEG